MENERVPQIAQALYPLSHAFFIKYPFYNLLRYNKQNIIYNKTSYFIYCSSVPNKSLSRAYLDINRSQTQEQYTISWFSYCYTYSSLHLYQTRLSASIFSTDLNICLL